MTLRRLAAALAALALPSLAAAQEEGSVDAAINAVFEPVARWMSAVVFYPIPLGGERTMPFMVLWLIVAALFCTFWFRFVNVRGVRQGFRLIRGDYSDPHDTGEVSHFQALTTALSGTVGLGNIAGVALAISLGGPGATFWMILAGFFGMSTKFAECTLGVKYRTEHADGSVSGGPMYYLSRGIAETHPRLKHAGKVLAVVFALCCICASLGGGNMFQANQSYQLLNTLAGGDDGFLAGLGWLVGLAMAVLVALTIIGGIRSIARVTSWLVPFMAILYVGAGLFILALNIDRIPFAFAEIVRGALSPDAAFGGLVGVLVVGFQRAAFSNEAGLGSAPIAHSAVKTKEPVTEGLVALWEPFIDTVVICTMTALVIIVTGTYGDTSATNGVEITSAAYATVISWFPYLLTLAVFLFAFSTMLAWSYYGEKAACYLFGEKRSVSVAYKLLFCTFIVIGASSELGAVTEFSDAANFSMSLPNVIGLYLLAPLLRRELWSYFARVRSGEIAPTRRRRREAAESAS